MGKDQRIAVISDAHGNLEALRAVLADVDAAGATRIVHLGDAIGYGPDPEAVARLLIERNIPSLLGNHEQGLKSRAHLAWFNPPARAALERSKALLSERTITWLCSRPKSLVADGLRFVHGAPPEDVSSYLFELSPEELIERFALFPERVCFVGHTHELSHVEYDGKQVRVSCPVRGLTRLDPALRHIVNAGSVGQPRDGNNNAKYVLFDPQALALEVRFIPYDFEKTARRIIELGFPAIFADRLR